MPTYNQESFNAALSDIMAENAMATQSQLMHSGNGVSHHSAAPELSAEDNKSVKRIIELAADYLIDVGNLSKAYAKKDLLEPCSENAPYSFKYNSQQSFTSLTQDDFVARTLSFVSEALAGCPKSTQQTVCNDIMRNLGKGSEWSDIFRSENTIQSKNQISLSSLIGSVQSMYMGNPKAAFESFMKSGISSESFGLSINTTPMDNRLAVITSVLRPMFMIMDRILPRVISPSVVYNFFIPAQYIYDLSKSVSDNSNIRNNNTRVLLVDAYFDNTEILNTTPNPVIARAENDPTNDSVWNQEDGWLLTGKTFNLGDLTLDKSRIGYEGLNFTDLISEGPSVDKIMLQVVPAKFDANGADITTEPKNDSSIGELYEITLGAFTDSTYVQKNNGNDSGGTMMDATIPIILNSNSVLRNGSKTSFFSKFVNANILVEASFSSTLNLKDTTIKGFGTTLPFVVALDNKTPIEDDASEEVKLAKQYHFYIVAFSPAALWNEDNMRRSNTAIQVTSSQQQIVVASGKNIIVDQALAQPLEELSIRTINTAMDIGNGARGLKTVFGRWSDVNKYSTYASTSAIYSRGLESSKLCVAARIVRPIVKRISIDFGEDKFNVAYLKESERLADIQAYVAQHILEQINIINSYSGYQNQLEKGEEVVYKVIVHTRVADTIFGIQNYRPVWDNPNRVSNEATADILMALPNGTQLEIVKVWFTEYTNSILIIPVRRKGSADDILNAGFIIDCGKYITDFRGKTSGDSVTRRCVANSREMVAPTNIIGVIIDIENLDQVFNPTNALGSIAANVNNLSKAGGDSSASGNGEQPSLDGSGTEEPPNSNTPSTDE